jgi:hypothetical protein
VASLTSLKPRILPTLNDVDQERHTDAKLIEYANDALREMVALRPDIFATDASTTAASGVSQNISTSGGIHLIDVYAGSGGDVTEADYDTFRAYNPGWRTTPNGPAEIWMRKPGGRAKGALETEFFLWPPQDGGESIKVCVAAITVIVSVGGTINLPTQYEPAMEAYIIHRCESEDDQHANSGRAVSSYQKFLSFLGAAKAAKDNS